MGNTEHFFLVLGMHRSGTSCLAGVLEKCGVYLGDIRAGGKFNKKGYFEIKSVQKAHDQILALNRGSWAAPPAVIHIHSYHHNYLSTVAAKLKKKAPCGLKDPRSLLILKTWENILGCDGRFIGTFRHPMSVAQSLYQRNKIDIELGLKLWVTYNEILVARHRASPFPLIHFDIANKSIYLDSIKRVIDHYDLIGDALELERFIDEELQHHHYTFYDVPSSCQSLLTYLMSNVL